MSEQSTLTRLDPFDPFSSTRLAAAGFLAWYAGRTREAYAVDLKTYLGWCSNRHLDAFAVTRAHIEVYVRWLEEDRHLAPATVARRLSTVIGFYRCLVIDGRLDKSPADYVRRPRVSPDSQALGLDRMQLGTLVATARASTPTDAALVTLLGLLGLRVSEACSVDLDDFAGRARAPHTLHVVGKGGKPALLPLPPPVARTLDLAADQRPSGPLPLTSTGRRMDRYAANRIVHRLAKKAGITHHVGCHSLRHSYITAALDAGVPLRDAQIAARHADPRTTTRYDRARGNLDRHANYVVAALIAGSA
jgi:integrase/recombinase XerD